MGEIKTKVWITREPHSGDYDLWTVKPKYNDKLYEYEGNYSNQLIKYVHNICKRYLCPGSKKVIEAEMIFKVKE